MNYSSREHALQCWLCCGDRGLQIVSNGVP